MKSPGSTGMIVQRVAPPRPVVAIVGRPNVGKSTLFNRLVGKRWAIINDQPGVTRDLIYAEIEWGSRRFTMVDSGGYIPHTKDAIAIAVRVQAEQAIEEADMVLLLCDASTGVTDVDREVAQLLRNQQVSSLVVVNKVDHPEQSRAVDDFYSLGLGDPIPVSAVTGRRTGDLLEALVQRFDAGDEVVDQVEDPAINVVLVGRPNVGKSTLINRLADQKISIVHEQPGTTRDTTHIRLTWKDHEFILMDTAGLRRRSRVQDQIEYYSSLRASSSIERADVAVVLIDAVEGCTLQDVRILSQVIEAGCGLVLAVNKWDLNDGPPGASEEFLDNLHHRFPFLVDYPLLFISGLTGKRVMKCLESVAKVYEKYRSRVGTGQLNRLLENLSRLAPSVRGGREIKLLYATQHAVGPPTFVIFSNWPELVTDSYKRFLEKKLRDNFDFKGTPIRMIWRKRQAYSSK